MKYILKFLILIAIVSVVTFGSNKKIVVDLTKQEAYAYENGKLLYSGWISSGRAEYKTKTGYFRVLQKEKEHISNEWPQKEKILKNGKKVIQKGGAKMPYMLRLTWSGIALHEGYTPNYPASHGCIRVAKGFAKRLYEWATIGTRVIVKGKAPRRVARVHKSFRYYFALNNANKYRKIHKRSKWVDYYAKFSYKKLNRILRKEYRAKEALLKSSRLSYSKKLKKLREIKWMVKTIKAAKALKYQVKKLKRRALAVAKVKRFKYKKLVKVRVKKLKRVQQLSFYQLASGLNLSVTYSDRKVRLN